jgi:hypothetical protein
MVAGMFQLLTQGTADIVLDCCVDYWDGSALCTLTDVDRSVSCVEKNRLF